MMFLKIIRSELLQIVRALGEKPLWRETFSDKGLFLRGFHRIKLQIRRQQGLWFEALLRIVHQHPAESHRQLARVIPDRSVRGDPDLTWAFTIPIVNDQLA